MIPLYVKILIAWLLLLALNEICFFPVTIADVQLKAVNYLQGQHISIPSLSGNRVSIDNVKNASVAKSV